MAHHIIMLRTEDKSSLHFRLRTCNLVHLSYANVTQTGTTVNQHLYIISDDEIKKGDWVIRDWEPVQISEDKYLIHDMKIIASTDRQITTKPFISESFVDEYAIAFNAGNRINEVEFEMEVVEIAGSSDGFEFMPKHNTDGSIEIKPVQSRKFTREEILPIIQQAYSSGLTDTDKPINIDEWIAEKLK